MPLNIGFTGLAVLVLIGLLLFGPSKAPIGKGARNNDQGVRRRQRNAGRRDGWFRC